MKELTAKQMLQAFDRALAEAANVAARRQEESALRRDRYKGAAEIPATYESGQR